LEVAFSAETVFQKPSLDCKNKFYFKNSGGFMLFKSKFFRVICVFCLTFSLASLVLADTIRLKDGSIIKGKIVNFTGGKFTVLIGDGARQRQMNFYADEVESIEFDATNILIASTMDNKPPTQLPTKPNTSTNNTNTNKPVSSNTTTVITVGDAANKNNNPQTTPPTTNSNDPIASNTNQTTNPPATINTTPNTNNSTPPNNSSTTTNNPSRPQPIKLSVKVLADNTANGWTNSGWVVKKGQRIRIKGTGNVSLGSGNFSTPSGLSSLNDKDKLMPKEATGALIAVIGDDNNDFILIGGSREFVAARDGALFVGLNEGNLNDNAGAFEVTIEIEPN
jgi:hypothetical protein